MATNAVRCADFKATYRSLLRERERLPPAQRGPRDETDAVLTLERMVSVLNRRLDHEWIWILSAPLVNRLAQHGLALQPRSVHVPVGPWGVQLHTSVKLLDPPCSL